MYLLELEFKMGSYIPSKTILSGTEISVWYPGQQRTCFSCHKFIALCSVNGSAHRCRAQGGAVKLEHAVSQYYNEIGHSVPVESVEETVIEEDLEPVVNTSPMKKKGTEDAYVQAGIVLKKKAYLDKEKLLESIAAVMSSLPEQERESPEICEMKNHFTVEFSHQCAVVVRRELEDLLGLSVLPLLDAREGLRAINDTSPEPTVVDLDTDAQTVRR